MVLRRASLLSLAALACLSCRGRREVADGSGGGLPSATATLATRVRLSTCGSKGHTDTIAQAFSGFMRRGRIYVVNGSVPDIREYDLTGRLVRSFGKRGTGPGEFARVRWIAPLLPDSLMVLDGEMSRVTVFDTAGRYARSFQLTVPQFGQAEWIGEYGAGLAFAYSWGFDARVLRETGPARDSFFVFLVDRGGHTEAERVRSLPPIGGRWWRFKEVAYGLGTEAVLDGPLPLIAAGDGVLLAASSDAQSIERWNGRAWDIIPLAGQTWSNGLMPGVPDVRIRLYDQLVAGRAGRFWLGDHRVGSDGRRAWRAFGPDGRTLSVVRLPGAFTLWQVDGNELLGKRTQKTGAECLEALDLAEQDPPR